MLQGKRERERRRIYTQIDCVLISYRRCDDDNDDECARLSLSGAPSKKQVQNRLTIIFLYYHAGAEGEKKEIPIYVYVCVSFVVKILGSASLGCFSFGGRRLFHIFLSRSAKQSINARATPVIRPAGLTTKRKE